MFSKSRLSQLTHTTVFLIFLFTMIPSFESARAATCSGKDCEGKNPNSTDCDVGAFTVRSFSDNSTYVTRLRQAASSSGCYTKWTLVQNISQVYLYAGARYWVDLHMISSNNPIAPTQKVYTTMHWPASETHYYCGRTSTVYVNQPMGSPCAGPA